METDKIFREQLRAAPEALREAASSAQLPITLHKIERQLGLSEPQANALENEVIVVLLGLAPRQEFQNNVWRNLGVDQEQAHNIAREVHQQIFKPIKGELDQFMQAQLRESEEERQERELDPTQLGGVSLEEAQKQADAGDTADEPMDTPQDAQSIEEAQLSKPSSQSIEERVIRDEASEGGEAESAPRTQPEGKRYPGSADPYREPL